MNAPAHTRVTSRGRRVFHAVALTVAEVEAMVAAGVMEEDERVELIGGELVPMSPKGNQHEVIKVALLRRWYRAAPDRLRDLAPGDDIPALRKTHISSPDVVLYSPRRRA